MHYAFPLPITTRQYFVTGVINIVQNYFSPTAKEVIDAVIQSPLCHPYMRNRKTCAGYDPATTFLLSMFPVTYIQL